VLQRAVGSEASAHAVALPSSNLFRPHVTVRRMLPLPSCVLSLALSLNASAITLRPAGLRPLLFNLKTAKLRL
jgi:hypothetical protein